MVFDLEGMVEPMSVRHCQAVIAREGAYKSCMRSPLLRQEETLETQYILAGIGGGQSGWRSKGSAVCISHKRGLIVVPEAAKPISGTPNGP